MLDLWCDQREWSEATFGTPQQRGPIGPLKHLGKEVGEVLAAICDGKPEAEILEEFADCFILAIDSAQRAGFGYNEVCRAIAAKQSKNRQRTWPTGVPSDEPVEHVKQLNLFDVPGESVSEA